MADEVSSNITDEELTLRIANLIKNGSQHIIQKQHNLDDLTLSLKLNNQNYSLWSRMIKVAIGGKSKTYLGHITGTLNPPPIGDPDYEQWKQNDLLVFSWLIQNIEPQIAGNLTKFSTARDLWNALSITYSSGKDKL